MEISRQPVLNLVQFIKNISKDSQIKEIEENLLTLITEFKPIQILHLALSYCSSNYFFSCDTEKFALLILFKIMDEKKNVDDNDSFYCRKLLYNLYLFLSFNEKSDVVDANYIKFSKNRLNIITAILLDLDSGKTISEIESQNDHKDTRCTDLLYDIELATCSYPVIYNPRPEGISRKTKENLTPSELTDILYEILSGGVLDMELLKPSFFTHIPEIYEPDYELLTEHIVLEPRMTDYMPKTSQINEFITTVNSALKNPLPIVDQHSLREMVLKNPELVTFLNFSKDDLQTFIDSNLMVAGEIFFAMMNYTFVKNHLKVLVNMEVSLHSLEVMNKLSGHPKFPKEYLNIYVLNCIQKCQNVPDKVMKNRFVRMVCVFIQSLIRNKIGITNEVAIEITTFCLEFNNIKEASALYKLLKSPDA